MKRKAVFLFVIVLILLSTQVSTPADLAPIVDAFGQLSYADGG